MASRRALVFGGLGQIGDAISRRLEEDGADVTRTSRRRADAALAIDPFDPDGLAGLRGLDPLDAVVWAQGANANDSLLNFDLDVHMELMRANCLYVTITLAHLLAEELVADGARLCVISSIWQPLARQGKYSYTVSKAAIGGIVHSAAVDLAERGILINAVLPSVTDTAMTRANLSPAQVESFAGETGFDRLTTLEDVSALVGYLCSPQNTGVTGQSIAVDLGYTVGRRL